MSEETQAAAEEQEISPIYEAFELETDNGASEDEVKFAMLKAGATFKNVTRLYNQYMEDVGLVTSKEERARIVADTLSGEDLSDEDTFNDLLATLKEEIKGATDKSAAALIRAYAKKNELECWKKPKGESTPRSGITSNYFSWLRANPAQTEEEAVDYITNQPDRPEGTEVSQNFIRNKTHWLAIAQLARDIATAK